MNNVRRYTFNLPVKVYGALKEIAEKRNTTLSNVMRSAIKWELLVNSIEDNGGRILVEKKKGDTPVVVLLW